MYVNIKNRAHSNHAESYWIKNKHGMLEEKNTQRAAEWLPVQIQSEDGHHSANTQSDVKLMKKKKKVIKMPSIFQRAQVASGGLDYGVRFGRDGGGCCKEWWDGNSFTAGRPQGSTFSTGTLSWKRERGGCYCFLLWGQRSSWHTGTFARRHKWWSGGRSCSLRGEKKKKSHEWTEIRSASTVIHPSQEITFRLM